MVARDAVGIGGRESGPVVVAIAPAIDRPGQRRFEHSGVAQPRAAAMFRELSIVNGKRLGRGEPDGPDAVRAHRASTRNISRSSRMISSASALLASNSIGKATSREQGW